MKITLPESKKEVELRESLKHREVREYELKGFEGLQRDNSGEVSASSLMTAEKNNQDNLIKMISGFTDQELDDLDEKDFVFLYGKCNDIYSQKKKVD